MLILDLLFHRIGFKATLAFPFLAPFPRETAGEATETEFHLKLLKNYLFYCNFAKNFVISFTNMHICHFGEISQEQVCLWAHRSTGVMRSTCLNLSDLPHI